MAGARGAAPGALLLLLLVLARTEAARPSLEASVRAALGRHRHRFRAGAGPTPRPSAKPTPAWLGRSMNGVTCAAGAKDVQFENCKKFCTLACDEASPGTWKCPRVPSGEGLEPLSKVPLLADAVQSAARALLAADVGSTAAVSSALLPLAVPVAVAVSLTHGLANLDAALRDGSLQHIEWDRTRTDSNRWVRALPAVALGLLRLDAWLEKSTVRKQHKYKVRLNSCWRDGISESRSQCSKYVLKGTNPRDFGLTLPGANPHSSGRACDLVLLDRNGVACTSCSASKRAQDLLRKHHPLLDFRTASRILDEALTNAEVGAVRLNYEAWHYEWRGTQKDVQCRCVHPECADKHWPPMCAGPVC